MVNIVFPQIFARMQGDVRITCLEDVGKQCQYYTVPSHEILTRVNELTELQAVIALAIAGYNLNALDALTKGHAVVGYKLKAGSDTRSINNPTIAARTLTAHGITDEELYETKMVGIPAIEKLLKAQGHTTEEVQGIISDFVTSTTGNPSAKIA